MGKDHRTKIAEIATELTAIESRMVALKQLADETDGRFQGVQAQNTQASQLRANIEAVRNQADTLLAEIVKKGASASESEEAITDLVSEAEESKAIFEEHNKNLTEIENKIQKFEQEITEQLGRAGSGALAVAFADRQANVEIELERWRRHLYWATGALFVATLSFYIYSFFVQKLDIEFFLKLTVVFPFIYAVWFSGKQYNKERFIVERYAFKSAQAKSLSAFSKTVQEMESKEEGAVSVAQQFVIDSVAKIYVAPKLDSEDEEFPAVKIVEKLADTLKDVVKLKS